MLPILQFNNLIEYEMFNLFVAKLQTDYNKDVHGRIIPKHFIKQENFVESIKKLVKDKEFQSGDIYCLPIHIDNHLIASILFKDFKGNVFFIINDSNGRCGEGYETLDRKQSLKKELNMHVIDLSVRTQFYNLECQIIAIASIKILSDEIAAALLEQKTNPQGDHVVKTALNNLDVVCLQGILKETLQKKF